MSTSLPSITLQRADGRQPFNGYLWPSESWWLGHEQKSFHCRWHFGFVALNDGLFSTEGCVYAIQRNESGEWKGRPCVFATRQTAIRVAAARLIVVMRASKDWGHNYGGMCGQKLATAINWVLKIVARETAEATRLVTIADPKPARPTIGLPLFDWETKR